MSDGKNGSSWKDEIKKRLITRFLTKFERKNPCGQTVLVSPFPETRENQKNSKNLIFHCILLFVVTFCYVFLYFFQCSYVVVKQQLQNCMFRPGRSCTTVFLGPAQPRPRTAGGNIDGTGLGWAGLIIIVIVAEPNPA